MTPLQALEAVKAEIETCIDKYLGQKEDTAESPEYVKPKVFICNIPHKNRNDEEDDGELYEVPHVLVLFDTTTDSGEDNTMILRVNVGVYGGGNYKNVSVPDEKGYIDLLTLLQKIKQHLLAKAVLGHLTLRYPCVTGFYKEEETWPYYYGYLTIEADILSDSYVFNDNY